MTVQKKYNILIVDDRPENLLTLEGILESPELNIVKANSGNEALGLLLEHNFVLVLMDVQMPGMDGFETAEIMRSSERTKHIPIIFVTAISKQRKHIFKGYETGAVDYLYKPLDLEILKSKIAAFIEFFKYKEALEETTQKLQQTIEQLHDAKVEAEEATLAKSAFLASMSHEIRTPLNGIIGIAELGLMDDDTTPKQADRFLDIKTSGQNLLEIINDILDISKIEAGKLELEETEFSIRDLIDKVVKIIRVHTINKEIELVADIAPSIPDIIIGDPLRLRQILTNLLSNAVKFTQEGSVKLIVDMKDLVEEQLRLRFCVADTGEGIPAEKQKILFEQYTQADVSTTRKSGGTGLGLNIARKLVNLMGGDIQLESEVGKGSRFYFSLNLMAESDTVYPAKIKFKPPLKNKKALVVDDNDESARVISQLLNYWKVNTQNASGLQEAIEMIENDSFDMVFLDSALEHRSVEKMIPLLEAAIDKKACRIVWLTKDKMGKDLEAVKNSNYKDFLLKPVLQADLKNFLEGISHDSLVEAEIKKVTSKSKAKAKEEHPEQIALPFDLSGEILIAEDQLINRKVITQFLERQGYKVRVAENGKEAVKLFTENPNTFFMILMDVQMPVMDGLEATQLIRKMEERLNTHIPIVAMTAHAMKGDKEKCLAVGMDHYLSKPVNPDELYLMVEKFHNKD
jgi:CheY-like chemotaxis protein/two-component sensor histidine kinase